MDEESRIVRPTRPVAPYIGGKRNLAKRLVARIEAVPHEIYAEAFVGMGGVFLRRQRVPKSEVINDLGRDVATLFRVLQRHYTAFVEMIRYQLTTRADFERLVATDPATLTDLERSARFLYLQRTSFGGKVTGRTFGTSPGLPARFDVTKLVPMLEDVHSRLAGVVIECLPWETFLPRYDRPGTLFYLDPPYHGSEGDYGRDLFRPGDLERLARALAGIRGRFILSINDTPETRAIFAGFEIEPVETTWSLSQHTGGAKRVGELIVSGGKA